MMVSKDDNVDNELHLMLEKDPGHVFISRSLYKQKKHTCGFAFNGGRKFVNADIS